MITVSVPGKLHLLGEHAIVYGKPALLAAVNMRMRVSVEKKGKKGIEIISSEPTDYARHAVETVLRHCKKKSIDPITLSIKSDIPSGYCLGSSAATAVGVVAAMSYFLTHVWDLQRINDIAYEVEKKQHGNPSGGDNTAVTYGGLLWYRKELEYIKTFQHLPFDIAESLNHFFLVDTGRPVETTREMVVEVAGQTMKKNPVKMKQLLDENEVQVKRLTGALKEENEKEFMRAMTKGERTLEAMGVVSQKVIPFIRDVEKNNGAAKILGGGGKKDGVGFLLCYHKKRSVVDTLGQKYGFPVRDVNLRGEGVKLEL